MFRKLIVTAIVALGIITPFAAAPKADAHGYRGHRYAYRVHRHLGYGPWFYRCR